MSAVAVVDCVRGRGCDVQRRDGGGGAKRPAVREEVGFCRMAVAVAWLRQQIAMEMAAEKAAATTMFGFVPWRVSTAQKKLNNSPSPEFCKQVLQQDQHHPMVLPLSLFSVCRERGTGN